MNNSTRLSLLLTLFFSTSFYTASAQKNFVKGFIVLNSGDTLQGLISDEEWKINPRHIYFKSTPDAAASAYSPVNTSMFRIENGNWYVSYTGKVDGTSLQVSQLTYNPKPVYITDTLFVRVLVAGAADLYYARDSRERDHFFIRKAGDTLTELQYNKYLISDYAGTHTRANEGFRIQLQNLVNDCPSLSENFMGMPIAYKRDDFVSLVKSYNSCDGKSNTYAEEKEKWVFEFSVIAGINSSKMRFTGSEDSYLAFTEMERSLGYAAGIAFNAIIPRNNQQWSVSNKLFLKNYEAFGNTTSIDYDPEQAIYLDYLYLKLATTLRYTALKGLVSPFIGVGITNAYAIKEENTRSYSNGSVTELFDGPRRYEFGWIAEAGFAVKNFSITGMLESSNGMSPYSIVGTKFSTWYAMIGYTF